jgi:hypothetical protein
MITAFFARGGRGTGPGRSGPGRTGEAMTAGDPGGRLPCPCRARRAEQHLITAHRRLLSALAVAGLTALAALAALGISVLFAIAVVAALGFAVLLVVTRSQRHRGPALADWRTWPPGYDPWADGGDPVAGRHEGSAYRPGYGFLPGHGRGL